VTLDIVASADAAVEKEHAQRKADLFLRVFSRELVIR
jgi:hypothetical protein